jgi:ubiquinone/menaquinone biosynthesis C-methylase UbiE
MTKHAPATKHIGSNIAIHERIASKYEDRHGEIFNAIEQDRLASTLARAKAAIYGTNKPLTALDFGCGSGNLTRHLLDLGFEVTAADVAPRFLRLVEGRFAGRPVETVQLNGLDLSNFEDGSFDFVATYSVLHHVPDYLAAVREFGRVVRAGGVILIDHELSAAAWSKDPLIARYYAEGRPYRWRKWLVPSNYWHRLLRCFNPRHSKEGDIHVWEDDHIDWQAISNVLAPPAFEQPSARTICSTGKEMMRGCTRNTATGAGM